ncbi:neuroligin-4, X-linked-like isoform X1 [Palaemon carinicauda]|uniref:neuroligin-4, X-linked-like isoform X1 n=1 Tax=Palaemon carinicauda TaxID=392227 RepID=UPI0035B5C363
MRLYDVSLVLVLLATAGHHPVNGEQRSPRVVTTKYGQLRGVIKSLLNKRLRPVEIFLGVPYAAPPVGKKRFSPTKTPTPWSGERIADQYGPVCPQHLPELWGEEAEATIPRDRLLHLRRLANYLTHQAEDCLYLNVYVPSLVADMSGHRALPVLVFVHGESFLWGASNSYDGSVIAAYSEVIVVTLNYRLGPLGFLNTNADLSERRHVANHGLLDQIAALHWIQENIGAFGGDPGSVTLMGHGTGAAGINFLMISAAVTPGLFHRAILMSGSALSSWATVTTPLQYALQFGHALNCTGDLQKDLGQEQSISTRELDQMVLCLKEKPLDEIQAVNIAAPQFLHAFGPSIDGIVIKSDFRTKLRKTADEFTKEYDLLFGVVPHESYNDFNQEDLKQGISLDRRDRIFRTMIRNSYDYHLNEVFISVVNEYTYWEEPEEHPFLTRDATMSALSDGRYVAPLVVTSNNLRIGDKNQYFYLFDYTPSKNDMTRTVHGAVHGDELPFAMGAPLVGELGVFRGNWSRQDELMSEAFLTYITNFVKTGNPNFKPGQELNVISRDKLKFKNVEWEKYDPVYQKYLKIGIQTKPESHYRAHQMALWTWLVPEMQQVGRREFLTLLEDPEESNIPVSKEQLQELSVLHHLFLQHDSPELYSGVVRPLHHMAGHYIVPSSTTTMMPTSTMMAPSTNIPPRVYHLYTTHRSAHHVDYNSQPVSPMNATAHVQPTMLEGVAYVSYSTALSVTVAIGVSLLLLNALIFAGVYYRRDRRQLGDKKEQQTQHDSQSSSEQHIAGISSVFGPSLGSPTNVDMTKSFTATTSRQVPSSPLSYSPEVTHISECPPAFADMVPCEESSSQYDIPPAIPLSVANGNGPILGGPGGAQQQFQQQKLSEEQQQARHYLGIPPPHSIMQLGPSESQPLLPINMPSPPHKKVPPYDELRV